MSMKASIFLSELFQYQYSMGNFQTCPVNGVWQLARTSVSSRGVTHFPMILLNTFHFPLRIKTNVKEDPIIMTLETLKASWPPVQFKPALYTERRMFPENNNLCIFIAQEWVLKIGGWSQSDWPGYCCKSLASSTAIMSSKIWSPIPPQNCPFFACIFLAMPPTTAMNASITPTLHSSADNLLIC